MIDPSNEIMLVVVLKDLSTFTLCWWISEDVDDHNLFYK